VKNKIDFMVSKKLKIYYLSLEKSKERKKMSMEDHGV